jgi:hypothetical protein
MDENEQYEPDLQAPSKLIAALRKLPEAPIFVPRTMDEAVARAAREHLAPVRGNARRGARFRIPWPGWAAALAGVVVALVLLTTARRGGSPFAREDVNHDGRVDILDSFALARQVRDGNGTANPGEVQLIAAHAVSLDQNPPL